MVLKNLVIVKRNQEPKKVLANDLARLPERFLVDDLARLPERFLARLPEKFLVDDLVRLPERFLADDLVRLPERFLADDLVRLPERFLADDLARLPERLLADDLVRLPEKFLADDLVRLPERFPVAPNDVLTVLKNLAAVKRNLEPREDLVVVLERFKERMYIFPRMELCMYMEKIRTVLIRKALKVNVWILPNIKYQYFFQYNFYFEKKN
jgi:hypothetical protein